jgi:murein DD-endopeptidase MepM/ murein hydrolase activator NlpD
MKKISLILLWTLIFNCANAQLNQWEIVSPLDFETTLSGNFAEMRRNHFHGGLDLRTNGEENKPVYSIDDGYVSKITISRTGYGKCAFINHPNGYTSVYGHLNGFVPKLDSILKAKQYSERKFEVTLELDSSQFPLKKGEKFALSGNTGASGGPHVHFEIRKTDDGTMRSPYLLKNRPYGFSDSKRPKIFGIKLYGLKNSGIVNNAPEKKFRVITNKQNIRQVQSGGEITAWGTIGFSIKANDYMTGTGFTYTPRHLRLFADGKKISEITIDSFLFQDTRALNAFIDYPQWANSREFFMKSFKASNSPLPLSAPHPYGTLIVNEERDYNIVYEVEDDFGNKDRISFVIRGEKKEIPLSSKPDSLYIKCGQSHFFNKEDFGMWFSANSLYEDLEHNFTRTPSEKFYSDIFSIGSALDPLHTLCDISIKIKSDTIHDKQKYYIAKLNAQNIASGSAGGLYNENGYITGKTNTFGKFAVFVDETKPVIAPVHTNKLRNLPYIRFKIYDTQSGIASYDAYIDDIWVMFEYDAKTQQITYWIDKTQIKEFQNHTLKVVVKDNCGNVSEFSKQIYW